MLKRLQKFFDTQLADFNDAAFIRILKLFCGATLAIILYAAVFSGFQIVDEFEHLHASWLVAVGKVPYKDFFEHHNPLLWYLSAPIMRLFYDNAVVFYVMRFISSGASLLIAWYIYKIVQFFGDKRSGWLAVALYLGNIITLYCFYQYRPDTYMNLCFIAGIYYWFVALKTDKLKSLIISFLCFTASFLFLQKISLLFVVVEFILLGLIFLKKMKVKAVTLAALPPLAVLFLFLGFFYIKGALLEYIEINYHLNRAMIDYFERGAFWYHHLWFGLYGLAMIVAIYFFKKENIYFKICALIYGAEFLMRAFYFAPHTHYYSLVTILSAIILSVLVAKVMPKYKTLVILIILAMFLNLGHLFNRVDNSLSKYNSYKHYQLTDWVHKNSAPDDMLMNGYDTIINIYRPDVSYYWFQLDTVVPIMEREYPTLRKIDINQFVIEQRPKFVYAADYPDILALRFYGERKYVQRFIPQIMQSLYKPTMFENLVELK